MPGMGGGGSEGVGGFGSGSTGGYTFSQSQCGRQQWWQQLLPQLLLQLPQLSVQFTGAQGPV